MFDGLMNEAEEIVSLEQPSLRGLAYALRHRETWPAGFEFYYFDPDHCGVGLAQKLWKRHFGLWLCEFPGLLPKSAHEIFFNRTNALGIAGEAVTPEHVADAIETYLLSHS